MAQELAKKYAKEIGELEEWIKTQPTFPQNLDKIFLLRFLRVYDFDLEKAQKLLTYNLEMRRDHPILFAKRDVLSDEFQQIFATLKIVPMPKNSPENHKITVFQLSDPDPEKYIYLDVCRLVLTMMDVRFSIVDKNELIDGEIGVVDMSGFGWKHLWKAAASMTIAKIYMKYIQEASPFKIVKNHFINCSPFTAKFMAFVKPLMKKEVWETITFHTTMDSLYEEIPREYLPKEFGGTLGTLDEHYDDWLKIITNKRDYLLNDDNWKLEEN